MRPADRATHPGRQVSRDLLSGWSGLGDDLFEEIVMRTMAGSPLPAGIRTPDDPADFRRDWLAS